MATDINASVESQAAQIANALRALKPNPKQQKEALFTALYPVIVERLQADVSQKSILELLAAQGLKLHPARFKELLAAEAKKRGTTMQPTTTNEVTP